MDIPPITPRPIVPQKPRVAKVNRAKNEVRGSLKVNRKNPGQGSQGQSGYHLPETDSEHQTDPEQNPEHSAHPEQPLLDDTTRADNPPTPLTRETSEYLTLSHAETYLDKHRAVGAHLDART